jgi:phage baseplate assembly protein V
MKIVRSVISSIIEGAIKIFSGSGRADESFVKREFFQHYGFTSRPISGSEGLVIRDGNLVFLIATDDRRYRLSIDDGEVAIYSNTGDFIHLKQGNTIHISTNGKLQAEAAQEADITSPVVKVNAATSCTITAPTIQLKGAVQVTGAITATGNVNAPSFIAPGATVGMSISTSGNITAAGTIIDSAGNTNHHSHP